MPHPDDMRLLRYAQSKGLLTDYQVQHCIDQLTVSEQAGQQVRAQQLLVSNGLMPPEAVAQLRKQVSDFATTSQLVIGEETWTSLNSMSVTQARIKVGSEIEGFTLKRELARDGMGTLYDAWSGQGQRVAIKVLSPHASAAPAVVTRFQEEARLAASLDHPNLIKVRKVGQLPFEVHFLVMDYFEGRSLTDLIRPGRLTPKKALEVMATVARACSYMHGQGVIHRDIRPSKIMVGKNKAVCLTDFGLAKDTARVDSALTQMGFGKLLGTPAYMAPEQARGEVQNIGPWSDVFAMGAVLFRALTGRFPFAFNSYMKTVQAIATMLAPRVRALRPDAPVHLDDLVAAAMNPDPRARPDAANLALHLEQVQEGLMMPPAPPGEAV